MICRNASRWRKKCSRRWQVHTHARLLTCYVGIINHARGEHRLNRDLVTPTSILPATKLWLWYAQPALLHSLDGRIKRRQRFSLVESSDIAFLLLWLTAYTKRGDKRLQDSTHEASDEAKLERAAPTCRRAGEVEVATRILPAEPCSEGNEETWATGGVDFSPQDHTVASAAVAAAVLASSDTVKDGRAPP